jgi:hypothetical protein
VLRDKLNANIAIASPVFVEVLESRIKRYEKLALFYHNKGLSEEHRSTYMDPMKETYSKHSRRWVGVDEMLYFNAPEITIREADVVAVAVADMAKVDAELQKATMDTLLSELCNDKLDMVSRKAMAQEIVRRRLSLGGVEMLIKSLRSADMVYTYNDTVKELVKAGAHAIPGILRHIKNPTCFPRDQRMGIWVLVCIGVTDPAVIQALQTIADTGCAEVAGYAQGALEYLQVGRG